MSTKKEVELLIEGARHGELLNLELIEEDLKNPPANVSEETVAKLIRLATTGQWGLLFPSITQIFAALASWPALPTEANWRLAFAHLYLWAERGEGVSA